MRTYTSISDFLEANGYEVEDDYYVKGNIPFRTVIYPHNWEGLTVDAFIQRARDKGWVEEEGTQPQGWREETEVHLPGGLYIPRAMVHYGPLPDNEHAVTVWSKDPQVEVSLHDANGIPIKTMIIDQSVNEWDNEKAQEEWSKLGKQSLAWSPSRTVVMSEEKEPMFAVEDPQRQEEIFRISDFYQAVESPTVEDLQQEIARLARSLKFANLDLGEFGKLLNMIPLCPTHRSHCLHYAYEWVEKMKEQDAAQSSPHMLVVRELEPSEEIVKRLESEGAHLVFFTSSPYSADFQDTAQSMIDKENKKG